MPQIIFMIVLGTFDNVESIVEICV